jgi:hypothetical protein
VRDGFLSAVNNGHSIENAMMRYVYVKGRKWPGLVKRRTQELQLWHGTFRDRRFNVGPLENPSSAPLADEPPPAKTLFSSGTVQASAGVTGIGALGLMHEASAAVSEARDAGLLELAHNAVGRPGAVVALALVALGVFIFRERIAKLLQGH